MESIYKVQAIERDLSFNYPRKKDVVHGLLNGLLSKQHVLILGPPGVAKSHLVNQFSKIVKDANLFTYLMTNYTTPEELFGPVSFSSLEQDKFERVIGGMLPEANVSFLDEIWKSNSSILNALLQLMNERKFRNGTKNLDVPLDMLVGASNEYPEDDSLNALFDRFLLRFWVDSSRDSDSFATLFERVENQKEVKGQITRKELIELQDTVTNMSWTKENNKTATEIWSLLNSKQYNFSDRRWIEAKKCIKSDALLYGSNEVLPIHFTILKDIMWDKHSDSKKVFSAILKVSDSVGIHIEELRTSISDLSSRLERGEDIQDIAYGIKSTKEKISALLVDVKNDLRIEELKEEINLLQHKISRKISEMLGDDHALKA